MPPVPVIALFCSPTEAHSVVPTPLIRGLTSRYDPPKEDHVNPSDPHARTAPARTDQAQPGDGSAVSELLTAFRQAQKAERDLDMTKDDTPETWKSKVATTYVTMERAQTAFLADALPRHTAEERVGVYLVLGADGWQIDGPTIDGYALFGYDNGAITGEMCEHEDDLADECAALSEAVPVLPNAEELTELLLAARQGPGQLSADEIRAALATLADLYAHSDDSTGDYLSETQQAIAARVLDMATAPASTR
jgi:hypothetical protein